MCVRDKNSRLLLHLLSSALMCVCLLSVCLVWLYQGVMLIACGTTPEEIAADGADQEETKTQIVDEIISLVLKVSGPFPCVFLCCRSYPFRWWCGLVVTRFFCYILAHTQGD